MPLTLVNFKLRSQTLTVKEKKYVGILCFINFPNTKRLQVGYIYQFHDLNILTTNIYKPNTMCL